MRILLLSDTHGRPLPPALLAAAAEAELILHAGDVVVADALAELGACAPVLAVRGNCDPPELRLPERRLVEAGGHRVGLVHGHLGAGRTTPQRALAAFAPGEVEAVVFGHSHQPLIAEQDGVLLVNPGSATDKRFAPRHTFGWLLEEEGRLKAVLADLNPEC